jgi:hypothetical protein
MNVLTDAILTACHEAGWHGALAASDVMPEIHGLPKGAYFITTECSWVLVYGENETLSSDEGSLARALDLLSTVEAGIPILEGSREG